MEINEFNKAQHTFSDCIGCYTLFYSHHMAFPLKPYFILENTVQLTGETEKIAAQRLIRDAKSRWQDEFGHSFTEVIPQLCPDAQLKKKKTKLELKQEDKGRGSSQSTQIEKWQKMQLLTCSLVENPYLSITGNAWLLLLRKKSHMALNHLRRRKNTSRILLHLGHSSCSS